MIQQPFNSTPGIHGGAVTFTGTRVPVSALFACLARGDTIDDFHQDYPGVRPTWFRKPWKSPAKSSQGVLRIDTAVTAGGDARVTAEPTRVAVTR